MHVDVATRRENPPDPILIARAIDEACDRLEAAWRAGHRPRLEDFLEGTTDSVRPELLRQLLAVEYDYRVVLGESPDPSEYRKRFPGYEGLISSVFAGITQQLPVDRSSCPETIFARREGDGPWAEFDTSPPPGHFPNIPGSEILSELGRGAMGVVYKARQVRLNRLCALKMILPGEHISAEFRSRFLAEAETIARLRHPNIVQIYGLGDYEGRPYFEMEYIEGGNLARRLDGTPWAPQPAARLVAVLARAIGDAHRLGIVHRDLKPANVLLMNDDTPKVVDFGLAKTLESDSRLTQTGVFFGTPSYTAPEQAEGLTKTVGPAADIYALGAIFYHMLTGRPPFQAATIYRTLDQVKSADPIPPTRLQPGLPRDVETICLKCLHKDPQRRYDDATSLAEDLERFLDGRPILARPTGVLEHVRKWVRRRPAVALLSAAVLAVTVLSFILVSWQWRRAEARAAAEAAANTRAHRARLVAFEKQAQLTLHQALALCDQGELGRGLLWLVRSLEVATEARAENLDRPIRINLADWAGQLSRPLRVPVLRHSAPIVSLRFRPEDGALVSVCKAGVVRIWDVATGKELEPPSKLRSDTSGLRIPGIAFLDAPGSSPQERDGILRWRDLTMVLATEGSPPLQRGGISRLAFSSDGRTIVIPGQERSARRWDAATRRSFGSRSHHRALVEAIALTPDGRRIITGKRAGRLHVRDADAEREFELPTQGTEVTSLAVSPDGRVFASGTQGGVVRLWDTSLLGQIGQTFKLVSAITSLAFDCDGRVLAVGGEDGTIRLWEVPQPKTLGRSLRVNGPVHSLTFRENGRRLLVGSTGGTHWWDLTGGEFRPSEQDRGDRWGDGHSSRVEATAVSPDGRTLAIAQSLADEGLARGRVEFRDAITDRNLWQSPDQPDAPTGLAFSPDSKWLVTWGSGPRTARLWNVATWQAPRPLLHSLEIPIHQAVFSPDGKRLLMGCRDGKARLWDLERDAEIDSGHGPRHAYPITAVAFDPRRARVVTGCHAGTVRLWDATHGQILNEWRQNAGEIVALAFSPDAKLLLTASHDGTARFVDAETGGQVGPSLHHPDAVLCVAFHPDGQSVVTGTRDGTVQRWRTPSPPRAGGVAEIRRWVNELTDMELDDQSVVSMGTLCD
jgi:WD40 repeat protein/tRNA A-37 threonylcarbamoyl transferase component Bud32